MNRHFKSLIVSVVMVVFLITGVSVAQAVDCGELGRDCFSRVYFGFTGGEGSLSSDTLRTAFTAVDEDELTYGFVFGYRMNKFFGLESLGNYFGEPAFTNGGNNMDTRFCNLGLGANFYLPLGLRLSIPSLSRHAIQWEAKFFSAPLLIIIASGRNTVAYILRSEITSSSDRYPDIPEMSI